MTTKKLALLSLALAGACASAPPPRKDVVWPDPPETARIRFVRSFRTTEDLEDSAMARLSRALLGRDQERFLDQPMGLAISDDGQRLYVADYRASHVFVVDLEHRKLETFAPREAFQMPFNVALDAAENVYVSDSAARRVGVYSREGERLRSIGVGELERPTGLALDRQRGTLYVTDSSRKDSDKHRVLAYTLEGKLIHEVGNGKGREEGQFFFPTFLALDAQGSLYVADTMNFRVQVFDADGHFKEAFGENGDVPGAFARLKGLAFDSFGNLYAVDAGPAVVQMFNPDRKPLMYFGGLVNALEYLDIPSCIAIHQPTNRIYVCNEHFARINVYDLVNTRAGDNRTPAAPQPATDDQPVPPPPTGGTRDARPAAPAAPVGANPK